MKVVEISKFEDSVVLYFDTKDTKINAYTLATTLVAIADAAKAANTNINPGHEIEIVVEALGQGSFKAKISAAYSKTKNIFTSELVAGVIIGLISNYIYERTLSVDESIKVEVHTEEVIIQKNDEKIIVPRNVYEATREAEKNPKFVQSIERTFQAIEKDSAVNGIGFTESMDAPPPEVIIPREAIISASGSIVEQEGYRTIYEVVDLQILKAILQRGKRKWEFMWRGVKISAPITSDSFYNDFFNHSITIAPGDSLEVRLEIKQKRDEDTGIYINKSYEVTDVYKHTPRLKQMPLTHET
ncbi:MAG: hypothetical protein KZQ73_03320 [Candidatus Thiodiazotropha sp. (ex Semelilucina semeliformis)]|nr:hypothetical protein [Candidatus Thiodiazotropha sp. (ex Semelilucina semeliformis)]